MSTGVHPAAGLVAPVIVSLIGAKLFYSQRATEPPVLPRPASGPDRTPLRSRLVLLMPGVGAVVAVNLLIGAVFGAIDVSVVAAATSWDVRPASGLVLAVFSLASGVAGFAYGARSWSSPLAVRFVTGVAALFASTLGLVLANSILALSAAGLLVGVTVAPTLINGNSLIGRLVPRERLTEGLSWMGTGIGIGASIGSSLSGGVIDSAGYHAGFIAVAIFGCSCAVIAGGSLRTLRVATAGHDAADLAGEERGGQEPGGVAV